MHPPMQFVWIESGHSAADFDVEGMRRVFEDGFRTHEGGIVYGFRSCVVEEVEEGGAFGFGGASLVVRGVLRGAIARLLWDV